MKTLPSIYRGDSLDLRVRLKQSDGSLVDLTGCSAVSTWRLYPEEEGEPLWSLSTESENELEILAQDGDSVPATLVFPMTPPPVDKGKYVFDIVFTLSNGRQRTFLYQLQIMPRCSP